MGIKFTCPTCGGALNVKSELAGKRGRCPKCQAKIVIPAENASAADADRAADPAALSPNAPVSSAPAAAANPTAAAAPQPAVDVTTGVAVSDEAQPAAVPAAQPAAPIGSALDPIAEAPTLQWYAAPPGAASQYGPASGDEFRAWLAEGRITAEALVWRQDWADWKRAGSVFPQLETPPAAGALPVIPVAPAAAAPLPTAMAAMPMAPGGPPVAQPAMPIGGAMPAVVPTAAPVGAGAFPIAADEPTSMSSSVARGRGYRQRSNTGPIIAIVVLLVVLIPLSYFAVKMVIEQVGASPPAETATGTKEK